MNAQDWPENVAADVDDFLKENSDLLSVLGPRHTPRILPTDCLDTEQLADAATASQAVTSQSPNSGVMHHAYYLETEEQVASERRPEAAAYGGDSQQDDSMEQSQAGKGNAGTQFGVSRRQRKRQEKKERLASARTAACVACSERGQAHTCTRSTGEASHHERCSNCWELRSRCRVPPSKTSRKKSGQPFSCQTCISHARQKFCGLRPIKNHNDVSYKCGRCTIRGETCIGYRNAEREYDLPNAIWPPEDADFNSEDESAPASTTNHFTPVPTRRPSRAWSGPVRDGAIGAPEDSVAASITRSGMRNNGDSPWAGIGTAAHSWLGGQNGMRLVGSPQLSHAPPQSMSVSDKFDHSGGVPDDFGDMAGFTPLSSANEPSVYPDMRHPSSDWNHRVVPARYPTSTASYSMSRQTSAPNQSTFGRMQEPCPSCKDDDTFRELCDVGETDCSRCTVEGWQCRPAGPGKQVRYRASLRSRGLDG